MSYNDNLDKINIVKKSIDSNDPRLIIHTDIEGHEFIYRKRVKGEIFSIVYSEIENISITYIKISDLYKRYEKYLRVIITTLLLIVFIFCVSNAIWDFNLFDFKNSYKRIVFSIVTPVFFAAILLFIIQLLSYNELKRDYKKYLRDIKDCLVIVLIVIFPYLYVFCNVSFTNMLLFWFIGSCGLGFFISDMSKELNKTEVDQDEVDQDEVDQDEVK